jgi:type II secretion system protein G
VTNHVGALVVDRVYTYGLDLISQYKYESGPGAPYWDISYYGYDGHGNVRFLTDSDGNITDTYDYDAFGTLIGRQVLDPSIGLVPVDASNESLVTQNNYLYCGEQFDPDLGLYFLRARYMDTDRGRFWTMDVWEGVIRDPVSLHKYLYANANPILHTDPSGKFDITGILGAFIQYIFEKIIESGGKRIIKFSEKNAVKEEIRRLQVAVDMYEMDNGLCPSNAQGLAALIENPGVVYNWSGPYLKQETLPKDPWGNEYLYYTNHKRDRYMIWSAGPDGNPQTGDDIRKNP